MEKVYCGASVIDCFNVAKFDLKGRFEIDNIVVEREHTREVWQLVDACSTGEDYPALVEARFRRVSIELA